MTRLRLSDLATGARAAGLEKPRKSSLRSLWTRKIIENARCGASRRQTCSKMPAPEPPDVEKCSNMLASKPPLVESCSNKHASTTVYSEISSKSLFRSFLASKKLHGAERAVENAFRSPALEDTSLDEASLRAFNARVHTSII